MYVKKFFYLISMLQRTSSVTFSLVFVWRVFYHVLRRTFSRVHPENRLLFPWPFLYFLVFPPHMGSKVKIIPHIVSSEMNLFPLRTFAAMRARNGRVKIQRSELPRRIGKIRWKSFLGLKSIDLLRIANQFIFVSICFSRSVKRVPSCSLSCPSSRLINSRFRNCYY